jgi:hypothetical protein
VAADVLNLLDDKSAFGLGGDMVDQLSGRGEVPAWEDIMVDEALGVSKALPS